MAELTLNLGETLDQKILGFKSDPEKMREIHEFLNELFEKACLEAEQRQVVGGVGLERKIKFDAIGLQNGTKRIGAWSNRARGLMSRVITAICNCTNSVRNATATNRTS